MMSNDKKRHHVVTEQKLAFVPGEFYCGARIGAGILVVVKDADGRCVKLTIGDRENQTIYVAKHSAQVLADFFTDLATNLEG